MTVSELRKALEGVADDLLVLREDDACWVFADRAGIGKVKSAGEEIFDECDIVEDGIIVFLIF